MRVLISNSPYCLLYNSYDVDTKGLVLDQLKQVYFSLFSLLVCVINLSCKEKSYLGHSWVKKYQHENVKIQYLAYILLILLHYKPLESHPHYSDPIS